MRELPAGWKLVRLRDVGRWLSGGTPSTDEPRFWGGDIPWISAASLKDFRIADSDRRLTKSGAQAGTRLVPEDAVLFVVRGMSLKKEFRVGVTQRNVAFGQDCKAIIPHSGIDGTFLALAMKARSAEILTMVDEAGHGTGRLPTDLISRLELGIPSLREQRRIAEILYSIDFAIDAAKALLKKAVSQNRGLVESFFCGHSYGLRPLGDVLARIDAGWSPLCEEATPPEGAWGVLKVSAVTSGEYLPTESKTLLAGMRPRPAIEVKAGDLLMCRANGVAGLVGAVALVRKTPPRLMLSDKLLRLVPDETRATSAYLELALKASNVRRQIDTLLSGSSGQNNISQQFIRSIVIPVPDLQSQHALVSIANTLDDRIRVQRQLLDKLLVVKSGLTEDLLTGRVRVSEAEAVLERL